MPFIPIKNLLDVYTIKDMAEKLGINPKALQSRIMTGTFPAPTHQPLRSRRKYYTPEDVKNLMLAYGNAGTTINNKKVAE